MNIYAVVQSGVIVNVIVWDGVAAWSPPAGASAVSIPDGVVTGIGATYAGGVFGPPPIGKTTF